MRKVRIVALFVTAVVIGGCSGSSATNAVPSDARVPSSVPTGHEGGSSVVVHTFAFGPKTIAVKAGDTVTWTNQDSILHTVTAGTAANPVTLFDGELHGIGSTFSFTFEDPGVYPYHCSIHEVMTGTVTVT
ncbi:MAG: plastocyanin/azurin family copper-binding protein [Actinomycetota bacterium]